MKGLIVDDEPDARARLSRLLQNHPEIAIAGEAQDGLEAVELVEKLRPELLFLDIEMPGLNGFEVLHAIGGAPLLPLVIFVTGYDQHALAAFEANAVAYLLKPIEPERLAIAVERAYKLNGVAEEKEKAHETILRVVRESPTVLHQIVCRKRSRFQLIPAEQIFWFQIEDGIVKARTATETFWVNYQLTELEESLPGNLFFRARREVLVNLTKINEIKPYFKSGFLLIMSDTDASEIVISERQVRPFRRRLPGL